MAWHMYVSKNADSKPPAIAVCSPFQADKEHAAGLYAQTMAEWEAENQKFLSGF